MKTAKNLFVLSVASVAFLLLFTGCKNEPQQTESAKPLFASRIKNFPRPDHVVVVFEENKNGSTILGNPKAEFINQLAADGVIFINSWGVTHPSQPNYLAFFSGSTHGVRDDKCKHSFSDPNLGSELIKAGFTFGSYAESMPTVGFTGCEAGAYRRKHNPCVNWQGANLPPEVNMPFSYFPKDFSKLPTVALVIPNQDHDMHDGSIEAGDLWLKQHLSAYLSWALKHNSLLVLTWDEDFRNRAHNHIATMIAGAGVETKISSQRINHYNLLRTIEEMYGLPLLGESARAKPIMDIWTAKKELKAAR